MNYIMINRITRSKRSVTILIFLIMASSAFSQEKPAVDKISTSAGDLEIFFIGHGSLMFRLADFVIYIDPVRSSGNYSGLPKADLILVTHEHYDHLDKNLINDLRKDGTTMYCNAGSAPEVPWAQVMKAGDKKTAGKITVDAVPAYNIINMRSPGQPFHPKDVGLGFVITLGDKRIYIAGDTENTPEMKALKNIDIAFLPMNLPYTMTPEMVADAAKAFKPKILYPYHFGETDTEKIIKLLGETDVEVRIRKMN